MLIAIGGLIASGKTTVATALGREMSVPVVEADRTRKYMLGVTSTQSLPEDPWRGAYSLEFTEKVYAEVLRRAGVVLSSGRPVVVDASFRSRKAREDARALAEKHNVPFRMVEVRSDPEVSRRRLERRARETGVSDGRLEIFDEFCAHFEAMTELPPKEHIVLDTNLALADNMRTLRQELEGRSGRR